MSHTKTALILMVAFAWPGAVQALGLGELHVDSALDERLAAEIDIVGATAEDLAGITASVANSETFLRFGVERPAFLSSATFKIATDAKGQPVLAIRSKEAFTEPLINMLIDLRWRGGELVRQYTLLLDPPSFSPAVRVADIAPTRGEPISLSSAPAAPRKAAPEPVKTAASPAPQIVPPTQQTSASVDPTVSRETVKVAAGATLHGIASHIGSRGEAGIEKLMIAIFRANPAAFEGNINRLQVGAELAIPSVSEVSAISAADANNELHAQMKSWHPSINVSRGEEAAVPAVAAPLPPAPVAADDPVLVSRVQTLEKDLANVRTALEQEKATLVDLRARAALIDKAAPPSAAAIPPVVKSAHASAGPWFTAVMALALGAIGVLYGWMRGRTPSPQVSPANTKSENLSAAPAAAEIAARPEAIPAAPALEPQKLTRSAPVEATPSATGEARQVAVDASSDERETLVAAVLDGIDLESLDASYMMEVGGGIEQTVNLNVAETANLPAATMKIRVSDSNAETMPLESPRFVVAMREPSAPADGLNADTAKLKYASIDVEGTEHHIQMPSILREKGAFKDRRTSLVDVLKNAVEREPSRRDLRMKLLETFLCRGGIQPPRISGSRATSRRRAREYESTASGKKLPEWAARSRRTTICSPPTQTRRTILIW